MRKLRFYKYHGAGNDFIMVDNREQKFVFNNAAQIAAMCNRYTGIGADGLILLEDSGNYDFRMKYYNADGNEGSMCGNGGRCIVAFAAYIDLIKNETVFEAIDGIHKATILNHSNKTYEVSLEMQDVNSHEKINQHYIINTGSPHIIIFENQLEALDVVSKGREIRNSEPFKADGINVNFVSADQGEFHIRTYERGVEDETLSCGTGCVAAAIALDIEGKTSSGKPVRIISKGGVLKINFSRHNDNTFKDVRLTGPAMQVYEGLIDIE